MKITIVSFVVLTITILFLRPSMRNLVHNHYAPKPLFVETFGSGKKVIVLLHGLSGTGSYWSPLVNELKDEYTIVVPDLLGFGNSPWPDIKYTIEDHLEALIEALPSSSFTVVGHSMGCLLAYELAKSRPELVEKLILLAPPSVSSRSELKSILGKESNVQSVMALDSWVSPVLCHIHEALGPLSFYLLRPFIKPFMPDAIVKSATMHRWESYNGSLVNVVLKLKALNFNQRSRPITFIVGSSDLYSKNRQLQGKFKDVTVIDGDHNFFWGNPVKSIETIKSHLP